MNYFIMGVIFFAFGILAFLPYYSKKDILFGYRISEGLAEHPEVKRLKRGYVITYLIGYFLLIGVTLLMGVSVQGLLYPVAGLLILEYITYWRGRRQAKAFVGAHEEEIQPEKRVVVSMKPQEVGVSGYWFLINVGLVIAAVIIAILRYDQIPELMPTRYDFQGNVIGYEEKSYFHLLLLPFISLGMTVLLYYVFKVIGMAKQELSGKDLEAAQERSRIFKRRTAQMIILLGLVLGLFFFYIFLQMVQVIQFSAQITLITSIVFPLLIIFPILIMAVTMGQGGHRIKLKEKNAEKKEIVRDDDRYWKFGMFYYNPDDPSVWVEKRMGIGWTMNFARPGTYLFIVVLILFILATSLLPILLD